MNCHVCAKCGELRLWFEGEIRDPENGSCRYCGCNVLLDAGCNWVDYLEEEQQQRVMQEIILPYGLFDPEEQKRTEQKREQERAGYRPDLVKKSNSSVSCPYCKSANTSKIGTISRSVSFGLFGFGSSKVGKQWKCNSCGSCF